MAGQFLKSIGLLTSHEVCSLRRSCSVVHAINYIATTNAGIPGIKTASSVLNAFATQGSFNMSCPGKV